MLCSCNTLVLQPEAELMDMSKEVVTAVNQATASKIVAVGLIGVQVKSGGLKCASSHGSVITISPECANYGEEAQKVFLVHEIGHQLMGPKHSDDPNSVMFERFVIGRTLGYAAESLARELERPQLNKW